MPPPTTARKTRFGIRFTSVPYFMSVYFTAIKNQYRYTSIPAVGLHGMESDFTFFFTLPYFKFLSYSQS
jgi:hypothetical protein